MARKGQKLRPLPGDPFDRHGFLALMQAHLEWMRTVNYSPMTIRKQASCYGFFIRWCDERGLRHPAEVTRAIVERYQRWLYHHRKENAMPLSFRSQHDRLSAVRSHFRWLCRQGHLVLNPASEIQLPRVPKTLPKVVLSEKEVKRILEQPKLEDPFGLRDRAIMEVLYSTGIRRQELVNLRLYDIDQDRGSVMVRQGKGKKDRMVPIGERALAWVSRYLAEVRPRLVVEPDCGALFLSHFGKAMAGHRLTDLVRDYMEASGIGKRGGCHAFRHAMATHMLENGADVTFIQRMLGHADLSTTQIYTQVSIRKLREIHRATHPTARLREESEGEEEAGSSS